MVAGRKIVLPMAFTDTSLPVLPTVDPIESAGSILLLDPSHPAGQWAAGVPAHLALMPNLLWQKAAAAHGSGTQETWKATYSQQFLTGLQVAGGGTGGGKVERTPKGGLHVIFSQTVNDTSLEYAGLSFPSGSVGRDYVYAHYTDHAFYQSIWGRVTRPHRAGSGVTWQAYIGNSTSTTSNYKNVSLASNGSYSTGTLGNTSGDGCKTSILGPKYGNAARLDYLGAAPPSTSAASVYLLNVGNLSTVNVYLTARGASPSFVFYRAYVEDLTVSGRSYAEVNEIDNRLYTKEVLTAGGRYYGDTIPTDPSVFP